MALLEAELRGDARDARLGSPQPLDPDDTPAAGLSILFEDADLLAVQKPAGLVTHPAYKHPDGTLCDAVFARQAARGERRPWLLHRLDRDTSGVVLFAKTEAARRGVVRQFERRSVRKRYLALLAGPLAPEAGVIDAPLRRDPADRRRVIVDAAGQPARTRYRVLAGSERVPGCALALVEPQTGRTHQIRAHLAARGAPLLGDATYLLAGEAFAAVAGLAARAMLHAWALTFTHPGLGRSVTLVAPPPADLRRLARELALVARPGAAAPARGPLATAQPTTINGPASDADPLDIFLRATLEASCV